MSLCHKFAVKDFPSLLQRYVPSHRGNGAIFVVHKSSSFLPSLPYEVLTVLPSVHGCVDGSVFVVLLVELRIASPMASIDHFPCFLQGNVHGLSNYRGEVESVSLHFSCCCSGIPRITRVLRSCRLVLSSTNSSTARTLSVMLSFCSTSDLG